MRLLGRRRDRKRHALAFECNICGAPNQVDPATIAREANTCSLCGSILRWRSVIAALSIARFGRSIPVEEFPPDLSTTGLGMSDWDVYASRLGKVFHYQNTFYDEEPRFDVMAPVPPGDAGAYDFIISSDVLEHVAPPYETALVNLRRLLKPGGVLILSVPMTSAERTDEHFPDLHEYDIARPGGSPVLVNRTRNGSIQVFEDLVFHDGAGSTGTALEMRVFSAPELLDRLETAGFEAVRPFDTEVPEHGIVWNEPNLWPVVARAPG